jgi:hypothetical protein
MPLWQKVLKLEIMAAVRNLLTPTLIPQVAQAIDIPRQAGGRLLLVKDAWLR